jgi:hypothetical protein
MPSSRLWDVGAPRLWQSNCNCRLTAPFTGDTKEKNYETLRLCSGQERQSAHANNTIWWVRRSLKSGKAVVVQSKPFTIQLTYEPETHVVQPVRVGIDPGRTNIGVAAVREDGTCLFLAKVETRNKDIPKLMEERKGHRHQSRRGERLVRKRRAKKNGTTMAKPSLVRALPGYKEGHVVVKDIINTEARFNNRRRPAGWLTPTVRGSCLQDSSCQRSGHRA